MTKLAVFFIMLDRWIEVKHLGIGSAGLTDRHIISLTSPTPPIFIIIKEYSATLFADFGATLFAADFDLFSFDANSLKNLLPDIGRLVVAGDP